MNQEFRKDLAEWFAPDPAGVSWGYWRWRVHFQDCFFTNMWEDLVLLVSFSLCTWLSPSSIELGLLTAWWSHGSCTLCWLPRSCVSTDKKQRMLVLIIQPGSRNWYSVTSVFYWSRYHRTHPDSREGHIDYISWWKAVKEFETFFIHQTYNFFQNDLIWGLFQGSVNLD